MGKPQIITSPSGEELVVVPRRGTANPRHDRLPVKEQTLFRHQYTNHLGSACLELDEGARIISYEEYYPYGSTSYQAVNKDLKAAAKRYRPCGS